MSDEQFDHNNNENENIQPKQPPQQPESNPTSTPQGGFPPPYQQNYGQYGYNPYQQQQQNFGSGGSAPNGRREDYRWNFEDYEAAGRQKKPKRNRGLMAFGVLLAVVLVAGIVGLSGYGIYVLVTDSGDASGRSSTAASQGEGAATTPELAIKNRPGDAGSTTGESDNRLSSVELAQRVKPSVVGVAQYSGYNTFEPAGEGSGIIMNSDGYILTNAHVVKGSVGISVELDNGETYSAKLIGIDSKTDLAVIKIDAQNLVSAEFGNSDELQVGEKVIAIGNPGGAILSGSVTQGIVSGVNRMLNDGNYNAKYIQVDAAINPGNSGGALVNEFGQVVGINSSKIAALEYEGIGFAIPINEAKPVIDDLMAYGYVKGRVRLGISGQDINEALSQLNSIPMGFYIWTIEPTSDLAGKNVRQGDIITHIDGTRVQNFEDIGAKLIGKKPGDVVELTVYRNLRAGNGQSFNVEVRLMEDVEASDKTAQ